MNDLIKHYRFLKWQAVWIPQYLSWTFYGDKLCPIDRKRLKLAPMPYSITEYSRN